ncbi:hypothetical protein QZH41_014790, partial [Actinostola sp. cb2023]
MAVHSTGAGEERKTEYINDELNPVWTSEHHNEFEWDLGTQPILLSDEIHVKVRDWEKILHRRLLGQVVISLKDLLRTKDYTIEQCYHLVDGYNRPTVSTILLRIQYLPSRKVLALMADEIDGGVLEEDDEVIEGEEKDEEGKPGRHKRRKQPAIMQGRREWSTRKRHYKISIKLHEGRQLPGANISPVARITIKKHRHETRVKRSTNSPVFNQTFTFNFHCSEAELFDDLIVIEVFNSRKLFRNALLGFFESDIGAIYEYPGHAIIRKWVLLTGSGLLDDDDEQSNISKWLRRRGRDGGTAGYLKVTMIVLGSGDEPPVEEKREDDDDIESNCLMPAGISREPAEFHMKVYLAEDLPQMDTGYASTFRKLFLPGKGKEDPSERKKLVDPFLVFSFSGKEVKTTTKYRRNNPSFNELLRLPLLYPSMCERIKLQLYDWDQGTKNDIIGTTYLSLPEISGRDYSSAFLPHFGPCFINFYGSPREFHVFNSEEFEDLNKGIGEGVAYRGRVLVELTQEKASGNLRSSIQHVHDEDIFRVQGTTIKKVKEDLEQFPADTEKRIALVRSCLQKIIDRCSNTKFLKLPGTKNTLDIRLSKLRQDEFVIRYTRAGIRYTRVGVRYTRAGVRYTRVGVRYTRVGVRCTRVGVRYTRVGVRYTRAGVRYTRAGVRYTRVGVRYTRVGVRYTRVGVRYTRVGVRYTRVGVWYTRVGVRYTRAGVRYTRVGVRYTRVGVRYTRVGVRYTRAGVRYTRAGVRYTRVGVRYTRVGVRYTRVGVRYTRVGVRYTRVGVWYTRVGVRYIRVGVRYTRVGVWYTRVGVRYTRVGVWYTRVGVRYTRVGVRYTRVGVWYTRVGVRYTRVGVRYTRVGVWYTRVGVRYTRVGVWYTRVGVRYTRVGVWYTRVGVRYTRVGVWYTRAGVRYTRVGVLTTTNGASGERQEGMDARPQISIPDVIIWMLCGGSRIAYHRIPIQDVLYSPIKDARGKHCGKTIELLLKYPGKTEFDKEYHEVPAMIRVELWVGLVEYQQEWIQRDAQEGTFEIYAETYENEINIFREWCHPRLSLRPHFSNASGDVPLEKEKFVVPRGWKFNGDWKGVLDKSLMYDHDWALSIYTEEIYEHQNRNLLGGEWSEKSNWTEEDGQPSRSIKDFQEPEGWRWQSSSWKVDADRAVDAEGWEYCISEGFGGIYVKAAKAIHMTRRRRWVRTRELMDLTEKRKKDEIQTLTEAESWEYAVSFQSKYHVKPRSRDLVRRKRLLKEIVHDGNGTVDLPPRLAINLKIKHKKKTVTKEKSGQETAAEDYDIMEGEREGILAVLPRMFIVYQTPRKYQLWVYIYQARDLLAMDDTGRSDPYVRVAFCNQSQKTEWQQQSLCPKWDQTLVFPQVELFDTIENVVRRPPNIIMEVFDRDPVGKHDFVGRCMMQPLVQIKGSGSPPVLTWITLYNGQANAGQVLATAELFLDEGEQLPGLPRQKASKKSHYVYPVRHHIRPKLQTVGVEILCWGVRNMKTFNYRNVDRPSVEFEWGNHIFQSEVLENAKKNPNFKKPNLTREIVQLEEEPFTPAMSIRVYDNRRFTQKPLVGIISISSLEMSNLQPLSQTGDYEEQASPFSPSPRPQRRIIEEHKKEREEFDWWSKYHYSMSKMSTRKHIKRESTIFSGIFSSDDESAKDHLDIYEDKKHDALEIFHSELEKEERFDGLNDFVTTLKLKRGKWKGEEEDEDDIVGELKTSIRVYQVDEENKEKLPPGMFDDLSEVKMHWPMKCLVRVYVICADPYLIVSFGGKTQDDKDNVQHNTLEPVFGRVFEFNAAIPVAKDLKIKVVDDDPGFDDDIGETTIDLEQRLMSRLHASCGLQKSYLVGGPYAWRDSKRPKDILSDYCHAKGYKPPYFYPKGNTPNTLVLKATRSPATHDQTFKLGEIEDFDEHRPYLGSIDQQLSLHALHCLGLVPEHLETRSLYSSLQPGIEQGKLKLWVDIFPKTESADIKPAVDIKPRTPLPYVLRVIIWDTTNVVLQETTFTGEGMSDIYVKGWIDGSNKKQKTDVHYRSLDGDGNFNWRMCFPLMIMPIEKKLVISKKENVLQMHKTTEKLDPLLKIQIWENDKFSPDDFLGTRTLCLNDLIRPCKSPRRCGTKNDPIHRKKRPDDYLDLFRGGSKSIRGWYACWKDETQLGGPVAGKVDMSIEILTEAQANASPAGLGREEPNQHPNLPEP